jgi:hypothetical protein
MADYRIPSGIDGERRYVSLVFNNEKESDYYFLVKDTGVGVLQLLYFLKDMRATSKYNKTYDKNVKLKSFSYDEKAKHCIITLSDKEETENSGIEQKNLLLVSDENFWVLTRKSGSNYERLEVKVKLQIGNEKFTSNLHFDIVPEKYYYALSLDFGSEASQMSIEHKDYQGRFNVLERARKIFDNDENLKNKDFNQYNSDKCLFNSIFFRKEGKPAFITAIRDTIDNKDRMCDVIPNLKMSLLQNLGHDDDYKEVVLSFIKTAIAEIRERQKEKDREKPLGLFLNLLVPNVMKMEGIEKLVKNVSEKFSKSDKYKDIFLEIFPISESDASFVGYANSKEDNQIKPNEVYLTIDGGKGTMDFSLIKKVEGTRFSYECMFRDGFIGSGNAITYALFDYLCAIMVGPTDVEGRKKLMRRILFESDPYGLLLLAKQLDSIKKNYNQEESKKMADKCCEELKRLTNGKTDELNASGLATLLQAIGEKFRYPCFGDRFGIIHATCYNICNLLVSNLSRSHIYPVQMKSAIMNESGYNESGSLFYHHVLLSGRAFMFALLREQLVHVLKEDFGMDDKDIVYDSNTAKSGCLNGTMHKLVVNLNCGLFGKPVVVKAPNESEKKVKHSNGSPFNRFSNSEYDIEENVQFNMDVNIETLMKGWDIELDVNDNIRLNGHKLEVKSNKGVIFNLYFTDAALYLRDDKDVNELDYKNDIVQTETNLSYMSRFPNYKDGNIADDQKNLYALVFPDVKQKMND